MGFSLFELIIVLVIVGILAVIAIPNMNRFIESNRLTAVTNDLIGDINFARSEAVKRGSQIGICPASGSTCAATTNWGTAGWLIFVDSDSNSAWTATDTVLRTHESAPLNNSITGPANLLLLSRMGSVSAGSGDFTICNSRIKQKRTVSINATGRTLISQNGSC